VWVHAASIGEMNAVLKLIEGLEGQGWQVLLTTMTKTSADIAASKNLRHQYIPYDSPVFMKRFYAHWQPDLIILTEQELWINLILKAKAPLVLVNARLSEKSFSKWNKVLFSANALLSKFTFILAQSEEDTKRFIALGGKAENLGNLKYDSLEARPTRHLIRPTWLAASTHEGEELMAVHIHTALKPLVPNLLTLICPRHAERGNEIAKAINQEILTVHQRSKGEEITPETDIYLIDTFGELEGFFSLSPLTFMGKSLYGEGGQNPIEAILAGSAVITGDKVDNFKSIYTALKNSNGALIVANETELQEKILHLLQQNEEIKTINNNALQVVIESKGALAKTLAKLAEITQ
jgi:3-deoxy-D-manno-octulosonic-acid transferase